MADSTSCPRNWLQLIKDGFRNAVKLQYDWPVDDIPSTCPRVYAGKSVC